MISLVLAAGMAAGSAEARSQQCPVDGGPCIGGGNTPVPPKFNKVGQQIRYWMGLYYGTRRHRL